MSCVSKVTYYLARAEHAFLLRCEGLTNPEIDPRLGCSKGQGGRMAQNFAKLINASIKRIRTTQHARQLNQEWLQNQNWWSG